MKRREDSALEVKAYLGSPGILDLPGRDRGRLESWSNWSFPYQSSGGDDRVSAGWVIIGKRRCSSWFPLADGEGGCTVELTQADANGRAWWSAGLEATGPGGCMRC